LGLTLRQLADRAGLSSRFVSQVEAGLGNISVGRLAELAAGLEVSPCALIDERWAALTDLETLLQGRSRAQITEALRVLSEHFGADRMQPVALVGMRGAGKSSVGQALAADLGVEFVELDLRVEQAAGLSVGEIFALHGESFYRRLELRCLREVVAAPSSSVVAVSGGIVTDEQAWNVLREQCTTVWLKASPELHMERVVAQGDRRPMANSDDAMAELRAILQARSSLYAMAGCAVETSHRSIQDVTNEIMAWIAGT